MADELDWACHACGNVDVADGFDGFFYCGLKTSLTRPPSRLKTSWTQGTDRGHLLRHSQLPASPCLSLCLNSDSLKALEDEIQITVPVKKETDVYDGVGHCGPTDFWFDSVSLEFWGLLLGGLDEACDDSR